MAEALVSLVVEQLGSIVFRELEQEVRLVVGVENEVEKLKSNLTAIQAVLANAETRQVKEATVRDWLDKLKDVPYDIEDVLDDWVAAILSSQSKPGDGQDSKQKRKSTSMKSSRGCRRGNTSDATDAARSASEIVLTELGLKCDC